MLMIFTIFFFFSVILMINMKMKVMTVDLDKSKVKLKLAPALGTSSVWGVGRHHARDQGHLGDRVVLDLLGLVKSTSLIGGRAF